MINAIKSLFLIFAGSLLALVVIELTLRLANLNQQNYVIEMWKYSNHLKQPSGDQDIGHEHIPNRSKQLQGVEIVINSYGLRGPEPQLGRPHRVAILGDSLVLGWGVEEKDTLRAQLQSLLGDESDVINAGVGNMNLGNVVAHWKKLSGQIDTNTLLLVVSPRATEEVSSEKPGFFLRHSQLAAIAVTMYGQFKAGSFSSEDLNTYYQRVWDTNQDMLQEAFADLEQMAAEENQRVVVFMLPESRDFINYKFGFMHERIQRLSKQHDFDYIEGLNLFAGQNASDYWVSDQDIHLNAQAHAMIADAVYEFVRY